MELVTNGYFDTGDLSPWSACDAMALEGGGVTHENPVALSDYNLRLIGDDCVRQQFARAAVASEGTLSLWVKWFPRGPWEHLSAAEVGIFEVRVEYADGGDAALAMLNREALFARGVRFLDPYHLTVAVDSLRYVTAVSMRCYGAIEPWHACGVTMEGYLIGGGGKARPSFKRRVDDRMARFERRLIRVERLMAATPAKAKPRPPKKGKDPKHRS